MIEQTIRAILIAHAPLMALLSNREQNIDLVDVAQDVNAPYLTFNLTDGVAMGAGNLCNPVAKQLLSQTLLITPWAASAPAVQAMSDEARAALVGGARTVGSYKIDSILFEGYRAWAREPQTNLLTRGLLLTVRHQE